MSVKNSVFHVERSIGNTTRFAAKQQTEIYVDPLDSATSIDLERKYTIPSFVQSEVNVTFSLAKRIIFEDGMSNEFTTKLESIIVQYGRVAIEAIENKIISHEVNTEAIFESLTLLGRIKHVATHNDRLNALISSLFHPSPQVRDGAALGIASIDDSSAIPYLEMAIRNERICDLKEDMMLVLNQLEEQ